MQIVCISDTHELHREDELDVPDGDLLIHAGDFTFFSKRPSMLYDFNNWLGELPHRHKVIIPGNHELLLVKPENRGVITNATLLVDSGVTIEGIRIWGSPLTPRQGGAFTCEDPEERQAHWAQIPMDTDILITHGPAYGILDGDPDSDEHGGCPELLEAVLHVAPTLHVCGHIHTGYGELRTQYTHHVNAALYDDLGGVERPPIIVDFDALRRSFNR